MNTIEKNLVIASRIIAGIVFIYSGFVKGVDPLGSTYKFNDYFTAFGTDWASKASFTLSILQSLVEFIIGMGLLLNLKIKQSSWGALLLMLFFTPLTLILALTNPVHDCGCFGDAMILTNWQTFGKNVILLIPVLYIFIVRKKITTPLKCWEQWSALAVFSLGIFWFSIYSYRHLPLIDFRPYNVGTNITEKMSIPDDAPVDVWESLFIYRKNGEEKEFNLKNLPDSTWTFVDAKHILISKGYEPPIHDFSIVSTDGDEITDLVLASENYNFLLIAYNLEAYNYKNQEKIEALANYCSSNGYNFYGLTASADNIVAEYQNSSNAFIEFYNTDETTLKTIIRSNPGLVLVKSGVIIDKWHNNDIPSISSLEKDLVGSSLTKYKKKANNFYILLLIMSCGLMITLYLHLRKIVCK